MCRNAYNTMTTYILSRPKVDLSKITVDGAPIMFVDSSEKIEMVNRALAAAERVGLDTEYYGHKQGKESPFGKCKPVSMQFSLRGPKVDDVPWARMIMVPNWRDMKYIRHFKKFLADDTRKKVLHNAKADFHPLENIGCPVRGLRSDTQVKCHMVNTSPRVDHSLKGQMQFRRNVYLPDWRETFRIPKLKKDGTPGKAFRIPGANELITGKLDQFFPGSSAIVELTKYAVKDPLLTLDLDELCDADLRDMEWVGGRSMLDYYRMFECEYTEVLYRMERRGCYVDAEIANQVHDQLEKTMQQAEKQFYKECVKLGVGKATLQDLATSCKGKNGLLGSKAKLGKMFTEEFGIKLPLSDKGQLSVKSAVLNKVKTKKHQDLIKALLTWREISEKLIGTYMKPICRFASEDVYRSRVRTTYKQTGTVSGRLASEAINLQNIPTRTELGKLIRSVFCAPPGYEFADADQSQIELRVVAHQSKDAVMISTIKANMDMHSRTAVGAFADIQKFVAGKMGGSYKESLLTSALLDEVKKEFGAERSKAKTLNFLVLYGGGAQRYAAQTGSTVEEGERVIENFFKTYPGLKADMRRVLQYVRKNGYVRTAYLKRYAHFPEVASSNMKARAHAERGAYNATVQGGAAELMKLAMIVIDRDEELRDMGVTMNMQVHDELAFDIPKESVKKAGPRIVSLLSEPYTHLGLKPLLVPTPADFHSGANWKDTH